MKILNNSPLKVDMTQEGSFYTFTYKNLTYDSDSKIFIDIIDDNNSIKNLIIRPTCGCTIAGLNKDGNTYTAEIVYDTKRRGTFTKQLLVNYREGLSGKKIIFNIKGNVQ